MKASAIVGLSLALIGLQSCEKGEETPAIPYYKFTSDDMSWLNLNKGEEWIFETSSGKQQRYLVESIDEKIKQEYVPTSFGGIISGPQAVSYYYDEVKMNIKRTDTVYYNSLIFRKDIPLGTDKQNPPANGGEFQLGGRWGNYVGIMFVGIIGSINVLPKQLELYNTTNMLINGKIYNRVVTITTDQPFYTSPGATDKRYIKTIYYAQKEGVISMVSTTGEIWNRVL